MTEDDREFLKLQARQADVLLDMAADWLSQIEQTRAIVSVLAVLDGLRDLNQKMVKRLKLDRFVSGHTDG
jgi:hypothetical protein